MSKPLFNDFEKVSSKQWKQKIQFDLKGADYNDILIWNTNHDITVKPFYHSSDFDELPKTSNTKATEWKVCETIFVSDTKKSNLNAITLIKRGVESIQFIIPSKEIISNDLLKNINSEVKVHITPTFLSQDYTASVLNSNKSNICIHTDIIGNLAKTGNWYTNLENDFSEFKAIVNATKQMSINLSLYQNAGANIVQQLAYTLAHTNEYLNRLGNNIENLTPLFNVTIASNYFFEIAKLRALRILWHTLAKEYNVQNDCLIFASPSKRNKTIYDYNTNMLRTTTECMSAILGGANSITNLPYDAIYNKNNEFGDRIARNQLLVLKNESYFDKVNNPADGAYYIESLTTQLAEKALELFKDIEANGGLLKQLKEGTIQRKIKESANKEQTQFEKGDTVLLGTNKHPNNNDRMKDNIELYPFIKHNKRKTLIEPLIEKRLAESMEQSRLKTES